MVFHKFIFFRIVLFSSVFFVPVKKVERELTHVGAFSTWVNFK